MFITLKSLISSASKPINISPSHLNLHLNESQLEPEQPLCPICHTAVRRDPVVKVNNSPDVWFLYCPGCHACSASRMPTQQFLEAYYKSYFEHPEIKVSFQDYARFYRHMRNVGALTNASAGEYRILDFGGGDGRMSMHIAQQLIREKRISSAYISLLDYNPPAASPAPAIKIASARNIASVTPNSQDMVLASGIFEHVPELSKILPPLIATMKPGARLYARVPYAVPMKQLFRDFDLQFPMHVHDLGPEFWHRLCHDILPDVTLLVSQPSIVKTAFRENPFRTIAAWFFKLPAYLQTRLPIVRNRPLFWRWVGGWEVVIERN